MSQLNNWIKLCFASIKVCSIFKHLAFDTSVELACMQIDLYYVVVYVCLTKKFVPSFTYVLNEEI